MTVGYRGRVIWLRDLARATPGHYLALRPRSGIDALDESMVIDNGDCKLGFAAVTSEF
jgi:hypothetical protein